MNKLHQTLHQRQTQELTLRPKMLQSLNMLALPVLELDLYLKNELISNPMLEIRDPLNDEENPPDRKEQEFEIEKSDTEADPEVERTIEEVKELSDILDHWNEVNTAGKNYSVAKEEEFNPVQILKSKSKEQILLIRLKNYQSGKLKKNLLRNL